jgi:hypothetical protein
MMLLELLTERMLQLPLCPVLKAKNAGLLLAKEIEFK